ncbi:MAG: carboxypeptidase regulatory-like domain-containing protein [Planctomycetes bacterium]|nr:carboxypeptidase regulatory-like domain-containing protein [Planctomycetota bacterium]
MALGRTERLRILPALLLSALLTVVVARREWSAARAPAPAAPANNPRAAIPADPIPPPGDIRGIVLDSQDAPAGDVEVLAVESLRSYDRPPTVTSIRTDAGGRFRFDGPPRPLRLVARRSLGELASASVSTPGPHVLRFVAPGWIEGSVRDTGGHALAGAHIRATTRLRDWPAASRADELSVMGDESGRFRIGPLAAGTLVQLEVRAAGCRPLRPPPIATVSAAVMPADLVCEPGMTVRGIIETSDGLPVEGALVEAHQGDSFAHQARSGADGTFRLDGLAPRNARLVTRHDGYAQVSMDVAYPDDEVRLVLAPLVCLEGRVIGARPDLLAVAAWQNVQVAAAVASDGRFRLEGVARGPVELRIEDARRCALTALSLDLERQPGEVVVRLP